MTREPGDQPCIVLADPSGVTEKGDIKMTTLNTTAVRGTSDVLPIAGAIVAGLFLLFFAGFAHANSVHNAAHDQRHSMAFPCH